MEMNDPKILVVDDVPGTRTILKKMLADLGFQNVVEAADGTEALSMIGSEPPALVIADYMMSPMSGVGLLRLMRQSTDMAEVPFVILTGVGDRSTMSQADEFGVSWYLEKPLAFDTLRDLVEQVFYETHDISYISH